MRGKIRASTPMYFLARKIKAMGVKMVLSGEGSDEIFGGYLYFHLAPDSDEFHKELCRRVKNLYKFDCLRANKSTSAWGIHFLFFFLFLFLFYMFFVCFVWWILDSLSRRLWRLHSVFLTDLIFSCLIIIYIIISFHFLIIHAGLEVRVPFLDQEFLDTAMAVNPVEKVCGKGNILFIILFVLSLFVFCFVSFHLLFHFYLTGGQESRSGCWERHSTHRRSPTCQTTSCGDKRSNSVMEWDIHGLEDWRNTLRSLSVMNFLPRVQRFSPVCHSFPLPFLFPFFSFFFFLAFSFLCFPLFHCLFLVIYCGADDTPDTKEAFFYRQIFAELYPEESSAKTVSHWTPTWGASKDPSGRCQGGGVHVAADESK